MRADLQEKNSIIQQKDSQLEQKDVELRQKDAQLRPMDVLLEQHVSAIQQLDGRLRPGEEELVTLRMRKEYM
jgi:uncharacterized protein (DUF3084 family)